jgi:hypothetical protein
VNQEGTGVIEKSDIEKHDGSIVKTALKMIDFLQQWSVKSTHI